MNADRKHIDRKHIDRTNMEMIGERSLNRFESNDIQIRG